jgi:hypothetical protein
VSERGSLPCALINISLWRLFTLKSTQLLQFVHHDGKLLDSFKFDESIKQRMHAERFMFHYIYKPSEMLTRADIACSRFLDFLRPLSALRATDFNAGGEKYPFSHTRNEFSQPLFIDN